MRYIYLHGFASSTESVKARFFRNQLGNQLELIDLNLPDFSILLVSEQLRRVAEVIGDDEVVIFGSSMGGLIGLILAEQLANIKKLVLLAPAIGINSLWEQIVGKEILLNWQQTGKQAIFHYGYQREIELHYRFIEDLQALPDCDFKRQLPVRIFHGKSDQTIPLANSQSYLINNCDAKLFALDDDHSLENSLDLIWHQLEGFVK